MKLKTCPRVMALLLCTALLLSLAGTAFASGNVTPAYGYVIANTNVNVRTGPNESYGLLGYLQQGSYATVTGKTAGGWFQVAYNAGYGYVNGAYVNAANVVSNPTTPTIPTTPVAPVVPVVPVVPAAPVVPVAPTIILDPATPATTPAAKGQFYVSASRLNVRSGPGTKYSVVSVLTRGQVVTKVGKSGNWTQIQLSSGYGYVYTKYLSSHSVAPTVPTTPVAPVNNGYSYVTTQLNIRSGAGEQYPIIGYVSAGTIVKRLGVSGGYTRIQVFSTASNVTAYVNSAYLLDYNYADAASRVSYPSCNGYGNPYGSFYGNPYNYYGGRYTCTQCGRQSPTSICPWCGGYCRYNGGGCDTGCRMICPSDGKCYYTCPTGCR